MVARSAGWVRTRDLTADEKTAISTICERFIAETLKPRFLPEVRPTTFNYPIDIFGKWRGGKYSFITRFRSGFPENRDEEFDAPFVRLDHLADNLSETRFDVMWRRHTGQWWRLHSSVGLEEALRLIETDGVLRPPI
jgi:hypothetical protein